MADDSVSAIDDKSNEINGDSTSDEKQSDWLGFGSSIVKNFFHIMVFIIIGSNFIFFTYYDSLDLIFPFSKNVYFPHAVNRALKGGRKARQKGGGSSYYCPPPGGEKLKMPSIEVLKSLGYDGKMSGWPYSMYDNSDEEFSWQGFKNWFAMTEAESFMMYRQFAQGLFTGGENKLFQKVPQGLLYVLAYVVFLFSFIVVILGFITTIWKSFVCVRDAWAYSLIGFFLAYTGLMAFANGFLQYISLMWNMLAVPLMIDHNIVRQICACNMGWISLLFGAMIVGSGIQYLDQTTSSMMLVAWIILLVKHIFF